MSARFIKSGANDFIHKPFLTEEFFCRIYQNLDIMDHIRSLKVAATTDYLTGLSNRGHFFRLGEAAFEKAARDGTPLAVAMLDIDNFKRINDRYGHVAGDVVLQRIGELLRGHFDSPHLVARFGGEEFCVLLSGLPPEQCAGRFETVRAAIAASRIVVAKQVIDLTVSIGIASRPAPSLQQLLTRADTLLYQAKADGRNRVNAEP